MQQPEAQKRLLEVIQEVANGNYSNDIMELTRDEVPEPIRTVAEAMGMMMVKVEAREYRLEQLIQQLEELNRQIKHNTIAVVSAMAHALAARDTYTEGHDARVAAISSLLARKLGMSDEEVEYVRLGGVLHDIGKIGFSDRLFSHHGKKNPPELIKEIIKHPLVGYEILSGLDFLGPALEYVRDHHERLDGSGYPRRIKGDQISLGARIIAVADGFDAMTTNRPYQEAMSPRTALEILRKQSGKRLDPRVVDALAQLIDEGALPLPDEHPAD